MSNDNEYFEKMAEIALQDSENLTPEQLQRQVKLAMKEVARDVRHRAVDMLNKLTHEVNNIQMET